MSWHMQTGTPSARSAISDSRCGTWFWLRRAPRRPCAWASSRTSEVTSWLPKHRGRVRVRPATGMSPYGRRTAFACYAHHKEVRMAHARRLGTCAWSRIRTGRAAGRSARGRRRLPPNIPPELGQVPVRTRPQATEPARLPSPMLCRLREPLQRLVLHLPPQLRRHLPGPGVPQTSRSRPPRSHRLCVPTQNRRGYGDAAALVRPRVLRPLHPPMRLRRTGCQPRRSGNSQQRDCPTHRQETRSLPARPIQTSRSWEPT
jgi:hypothetical protein